MSAQLNWKPVIGSLLSILQHHGFELSGVDDGDGRCVDLKGTPRQRRQKAKHIIDSVDESHLYIRTGTRTLCIWIVLGNSPEETPADYSSHDGLEKAIEEFSNKWAGISCPVINKH